MSLSCNDAIWLAPGENLPCGNETILVVEDDEVVRDIAVQALQMCGYKVIEADGGPQALDLCASLPGPIHLIITDVVMPGMSGREFVERVREARGRCNVLYMSGYSDDIALEQGTIEEGAQFIGKPFVLAALLTKVRNVLDSASAAQRGDCPVAAEAKGE